jgi:hypothetical protein
MLLMILFDGFLKFPLYLRVYDVREANVANGKNTRAERVNRDLSPTATVHGHGPRARPIDDT